MEYENEEFWRALLTNRKFRSRFIRDLEMQAIESRSTEELLERRRDEELTPLSGPSPQNSASSLSW